MELLKQLREWWDADRVVIEAFPARYLTRPLDYEKYKVKKKDMTKEEIKRNALKAAEEKIDEMLKDYKEPIKGRWGRELKMNSDVFWYLAIDGSPNYGMLLGRGRKELLALGNYFETREKARKHVDKLKLIEELKDYAAEVNGDWKPDWNCANEPKNYIYKSDQGINSDCVGLKDLGCVVYFKSRNRAEVAITKFGDRLNLLFED